MLLDCRSTKHATVQGACMMLLFNRDIRHHYYAKLKTYRIKKKKKKHTNSKKKSKMRTDKKMSVKISDIKVGDKILLSNENETNLQPYINLNYLQQLKRKETRLKQ